MSKKPTSALAELPFTQSRLPRSAPLPMLTILSVATKWRSGSTPVLSQANRTLFHIFHSFPLSVRIGVPEEINEA